jgi:hypothetical protein
MSGFQRTAAKVPIESADTGTASEQALAAQKARAAQKAALPVERGHASQGRQLRVVERTRCQQIRDQCQRDD